MPRLISKRDEFLRVVEPAEAILTFIELRAKGTWNFEQCLSDDEHGKHVAIFAGEQGRTITIEATKSPAGNWKLAGKRDGT
jgi:hypothetical protein